MTGCSMQLYVFFLRYVLSALSILTRKTNTIAFCSTRGRCNEQEISCGRDVANFPMRLAEHVLFLVFTFSLL